MEIPDHFTPPRTFSRRDSSTPIASPLKPLVAGNRSPVLPTSPPILPNSLSLQPISPGPHKETVRGNRSLLLPKSPPHLPSSPGHYKGAVSPAIIHGVSSMKKKHVMDADEEILRLEEAICDAQALSDVTSKAAGQGVSSNGPAVCEEDMEPTVLADDKSKMVDLPGSSNVMDTEVTDKGESRAMVAMPTIKKEPTCSIPDAVAVSPSRTTHIKSESSTPPLLPDDDGAMDTGPVPAANPTRPMSIALVNPVVKRTITDGPARSKSKSSTPSLIPETPPADSPLMFDSIELDPELDSVMEGIEAEETLRAHQDSPEKVGQGSVVASHPGDPSPVTKKVDSANDSEVVDATDAAQSPPLRLRTRRSNLRLSSRRKCNTNSATNVSDSVLLYMKSDCIDV